MHGEVINDAKRGIEISFGYQCSYENDNNLSNGIDIPCAIKTQKTNGSFSYFAPKSDGFLNTTEVEVAGGAAGEDRVQAVCSEENRWLFCAIYDGFNGRDAADFLAGTLYDTIGYHLNLLDLELDQAVIKASDLSNANKYIPYLEKSCGLIKERVLGSLQRALAQAENDFLHMVEQEMEDRPDLVSVGSCVLVVLLHGKNLYVLNVGDSRAVLATCGECSDMNSDDGLLAVQLSDTHTVENEEEKAQLLQDHPHDSSIIVGGKVKGKLKVTRALGVGYLKKKHMNDVLMGILQVRNLLSPPYISVQPSLKVHEISDYDHFAVLGSDGLFDFFSNEEIVKLVYSYISSYPSGDPAKFLVEQLLVRAADCAGFTIEELMSVPAGRRRKYHDDITVIVIILGMNKRTSKASARLL
ncbi:unnamed protein product [Coffea canephora]|uniref:PPM-type phosphatase domain-containing protein n=1 Tax=Coffea canephora TaxID=49390 RepID=A0A068TRL2_COFCA|nr:unnamed protein product [Coffea canephora]